MGRLDEDLRRHPQRACRLLLDVPSGFHGTVVDVDLLRFH
jgi:hypothetical protein